jgi:hypothetical protein
MTFDPNNGIIYAANVYFDSIYRTDEKHFPTVMGIAKIGGFPSDIAVDKDFQM